MGANEYLNRLIHQKNGTELITVIMPFGSLCLEIDFQIEWNENHRETRSHKPNSIKYLNKKKAPLKVKPNCIVSCYLAIPIALFSLITVTLTCPG